MRRLLLAVLIAVSLPAGAKAQDLLVFAAASLKTALDEISSAMGSKVKIVKLNVDESPRTASKYGVMSIPTLMIFKGGELASHQVGAAPKQKLEQWITAAV